MHYILMQNPAMAIHPVPLAQLQPVGLSPDETTAVIAAAARLDDGVRWILPMPGFRPDAYVTHLRSVDFPGEQVIRTAAEALHQPPRRLLVDENGRHGGRPVCILGNSEASHSRWSAERPGAIAELDESLRFAARQLMPQRLHYTLARIAWERRQQWKNRQFHLVLDHQPIATIEPTHWRMSLRTGVTPKQLAEAEVIARPHSADMPSKNLEPFPMAQALWTLAQRCDAESLPEMLPTSFLDSRLCRRHALPVTASEAGQHCLTVLDALEMTSLNAEELRAMLELPEPVLMRALTCLALGRAIRQTREENPISRLSTWLPSAWRQSLAHTSELD